MNRDNTQKQLNTDMVIGEITEFFIIDEFKKLNYYSEKRKGCDVLGDMRVWDKVGKFLYNVEVKTDLESNFTPNFFIEFEYRYKPSGIKTTDSKYWVQSDGWYCYIFNTKLIKNLCDKKKFRVGEVSGYNNQARGFLIPKNEMLEINHKQIEIPMNVKAHYSTIAKLKWGNL